MPQGKLRIGLGEQAVLNSLAWASLLHWEDSAHNAPQTADSSPAKVHSNLQYADLMLTWWQSPKSRELLKLPRECWVTVTQQIPVPSYPRGNRRLGVAGKGAGGRGPVRQARVGGGSRQAGLQPVPQLRCADTCAAEARPHGVGPPAPLNPRYLG